jgi:parallel beta-helix repeat protein
MLSLLAVSALALGHNVQPVKTEPATITVPDDYPTIQEAINAASDGDTVFVRNGTYYENIQIPKSLTLEGESRQATIIDGGGYISGGMRAFADNVRISKFTIQHAGSVYVEGYVNMTFSDSIIMDSYQGVRLVSTSGCVISDNIMDGNSLGGIGLDWANNNIIHNNTLTNSVGLGAIHGGYPSYNNTLSENTITGNAKAIEMNNIFSGNQFFHNNFINNAIQVSFNGPIKVNSWDDEKNVHDGLYRYGGNYWSDYNGSDDRWGPYPPDMPDPDGIGDTPYTIDANNTDYYPLMQPWSPPDVAMTGYRISKTVTCQNCKYIFMYVNIMNRGNLIQFVNVSMYASEGWVSVLSIMRPALTGTYTLPLWTYNWAKGNYTMNAVVVVLDEVDTTDNSMACWFIVAMEGDITGPTGYPDGKVDARDVAGICSRYGAKPPDPRYDVNWDITGPDPGVEDGKIDARDVSLVSSRYGQKDP